jgi:hypothetical protein
MNVHKNARLTPRGRERIVRQVESGQAPKPVAEAAGVCPRTVRKGLIDTAVKDWQACRIAHPGRIGCADRASDGCRGDRTAAAPTLDGQADRRRDWRLASHRQPCSASARLE